MLQNPKASYSAGGPAVDVLAPRVCVGTTCGRIVICSAVVARGATRDYDSPTVRIALEKHAFDIVFIFYIICSGYGIAE